MSITLGKIEIRRHVSCASNVRCHQKNSESYFALFQGRARSKAPALENGLSNKVVLESMIPGTGNVPDIDFALLNDANV